MKTLTAILTLAFLALVIRSLTTRDEEPTAAREHLGSDENPATEDSIREYIREGRKIEAIRAYRRHYDVGRRRNS